MANEIKRLPVNPRFFGPVGPEEARSILDKLNEREATDPHPFEEIALRFLMGEIEANEMAYMLQMEMESTAEQLALGEREEHAEAVGSYGEDCPSGDSGVA